MRYILQVRMAIFGFDLLFLNGRFHTWMIALSKDTRGVCGPSQVAVEVPISWACYKRVESRRAAGGELPLSPGELLISLVLQPISPPFLRGKCPHDGRGVGSKNCLPSSGWSWRPLERDAAGAWRKRRSPWVSEWVTQDVVWELAVIFTTQFHSAGLNSLQHSIDDDAWRYKGCILISKSRASLPLVMNTLSELQVKEIL